MDILGIGPLELFFILLIALIVFGPNDMVKAGRSLGKFLRRIVQSPGWQIVQKTSQDIRYLPNRLMREAGLDELKEEMPQISPVSLQHLEINEKKKEEKQKKIEEGITAWTTPPTLGDETEEASIPPEEIDTSSAESPTAENS
ncbi:MAG: twin-arginine translocase TatA/TatE family subunit [Anaerolineales bacterium]|jgi:Sec-independent protein translocase protein TatA